MTLFMYFCTEKKKAKKDFKNIDSFYFLESLIIYIFLCINKWVDM